MALNQDSLRKTLENFQYFFLQNSASMGLISLNSLALTDDGTLVYTSAQKRKTEFVIANATVSIISLTVISVGIPIATVITLDMTYTC